MIIKRVFIFFFLVFVMFLDVASAQGGSVEYSSQFFPTGGRRICVKGGDSQTVMELSERLARHGAIVSSNIFAKIFSPKIELNLQSQIQGYTSAFEIIVRSKNIKINYTSAELLSQAIEEFYTLFDEPYGQRMIRGCNLLYYSKASKATYVSIRQNQFGVYDGVTKLQSCQEIESEITHKLKRKRGADFVLAMANSKIVRIQFNVMEGINPSMGTLHQFDSYSDQDIKQFIEVAEKNHGTFVPAIDLLSDSEIFKQYTGHTMQSIEGMRFVRAMLEECKNRWGFNKICIGTISKSNVTKEYLEFLFYIAARNNITLITL